MSFNTNELKQRMDGAIDMLKKEFSGLRTGRASVSLLEPVTVEAYGSHSPLSQVASVSAPEPRLLTVSVWDRALAGAVEKAIRDAGLGLNPAAEGTIIRVPVPALTEERRKDLTKVASKYAEASKVAIRNVRRDGMDGLKKMEKDKLISEDELKKFEKDVQKLTDDYVAKVDETLAHKEKEIMEV
ncbi:MAG TPA: ribosome recycling factor [Alphaproteobacteria bacterium]